MEVTCVCGCACTSAVHVASHHGVQVSSLQVQQQAGFRVHMPFQDHEGVEDHLDTHTHTHTHADAHKCTHTNKVRMEVIVSYSRLQ